MNACQQKPAAERRLAGATGLRYVLITPARNEATLIEQTIQAVVAQTALPEKWVIVSDGSTDGTDEIVKKYAARHPWIELVRMPERTERHFAGKVGAFNAGRARMENTNYDIIGNLDADATFDPEYLAFLLERFAENPRVGIAGTPFQNEGSAQSEYDYRFTSVDHVTGICQLFRRDCFEEIGGYIPIQIGGVDLAVVLKARMKGWETRTFLGKNLIHHRKMGTAKTAAVWRNFQHGCSDYRLGSSPLWATFRCFYHMMRPRTMAGGVLRLAGFLWAMLRGMEKVLPIDVVRFRRAEQMQRMRAFFRQVFRRQHPGTA